VRVKVHYQPPFCDYTGEGNHEPLACGMNGVWKVSNCWSMVDCKLCLRRKPRRKK